MQRLLLITCVAVGLAGCASSSTPPAQTSVKKDLRAELLTYRSSAEVCTSTSPKCMEWMALALECEQNLANGVAGNACTRAETYREQVTGIALSTTPGAYSF